MTPTEKGRGNGTSPRPSRSTDQQTNAHQTSGARPTRDPELVAIAAEYEEQLRRIAEDFQNSTIYLLHPSENSALELERWKSFASEKTKWMRQATDSIEAYIMKLRQKLNFDAALEECKEVYRNQFKGHLDRLRDTVVEVFVVAARANDVDPCVVEQTKTKEFESEIRGAVERAFRSPLQTAAPQTVPGAVQPDAVGPCLTKRRRGPEVKFDRYKVIADIARRNEPFRKPENEKKIKELLDSVLLVDGEHIPPPKPRDKSEAPAKTWAEVSRDRYLNAVRYAYKRVPRE